MEMCKNGGTQKKKQPTAVGRPAKEVRIARARCKGLEVGSRRWGQIAGRGSGAPAARGLGMGLQRGFSRGRCGFGASTFEVGRVAVCGMRWTGGWARIPGC